MMLLSDTPIHVWGSAVCVCVWGAYETSLCGRERGARVIRPGAMTVIGTRKYFCACKKGPILHLID